MDQSSPFTKQLAMRERTNAFAVDTVRLCRSIPLSFEGRHVAGQLIRSSTSVAANYRAACRARSRRDFVSKIGIVLEESDESLFWLEFAQKIELLSSEKAGVVTAEAGELLAIFSATSATARQRLKPSKG